MISEFSRLTGVTEESILGRGKKNGVSDYRHVYWYLLHRNGLSYAEIGRLCGITHASAIFAVRKVESLLSINDRRIVELYELTKDIKK